MSFQTEFLSCEDDYIDPEMLMQEGMMIDEEEEEEEDLEESEDGTVTW